MHKALSAIPDKIYWYEPRKRNSRPPSNCRGSVYGIFYTYEEISAREMDRLDLLEIGYMTREEMLDLLELGYITKK